MLLETTPFRAPTADPADLQQAWRRQWSRLGFAYHHLLGARTILAGLPDPDPTDVEVFTALLCLLFEARDQGHLCLPLSGLATAWAVHPGAEQLALDWNFGGMGLSRKLLATGLAYRASDRMAAPAQDCAALIFDGDGPDASVYFQGMHRAETRLLQLLARHGNQAALPAPESLHAGLDAWFRQLPARHQPEKLQAAAVHQALDHRLFILGGGPGTGKTTTVFHLLHGLFLAGTAKLALAAPTGRAAARLQESLARSLTELREWLGSDHDRAFADWLGAARGMTLHRLLGQSSVFSEFDSDLTPLPFDLIVVDEASMVDLDQMLLLLTRLPATARLILVGDQNQLPSVGAGSILADLAGGERFIARVQLEHCFRSDTAILDCAKAVLAGRLPDLGGSTQGTIQSLSLGARHQANQVRHQLISRWAGEQDITSLAAACRFGDRPAADPATAARLYAEASRSVLLSPLREGPWGVQALNAQVAALLGPATEWPAGMMAMVTRNDYQRGLFNGDRGLVCRWGGRPMVWFPDPAATGGGRWFSPFTIAGLEPAWALTVHKSQGSEYDTVWLFLGESASPEGQVSRELLYTGITRAKRRLVLAADAAALASACGRAVQRHSGISRRAGEFPSASE